MQQQQPSWMDVPDAPPTGGGGGYAPPVPPGADGGPPPGAYPGAAAEPSAEEGTTKKSLVQWALRTIIIGMTIMMAAAGALSLASLSTSDNAVSDFFVGLYVILFAAILFVHEINQVFPVATIDQILRKNFGFLFKALGKGAFILFIAFLNFGLSTDNDLGLATGICLCIVGAGWILLYLRNPEFFEDQAAPKTVGYQPANQSPGY